MTTVYVLVVNHRHGDNVYACSTKEKAYATLYAYVQRWWDYEEFGGDCPELNEAINTYFESVDETWEIHELVVDASCI